MCISYLNCSPTTMVLFGSGSLELCDLGDGQCPPTRCRNTTSGLICVPFLVELLKLPFRFCVFTYLFISFFCLEEWGLKCPTQIEFPLFRLIPHKSLFGYICKGFLFNYRQYLFNATGYDGAVLKEIRFKNMFVLLIVEPVINLRHSGQPC